MTVTALQDKIMKVKPLPAPAGLKGRLVYFVIGRTAIDLEATATVESKALRRAPNYPEVIPTQKVIKLERKPILEKEVSFLVKAYVPGVVIAEARVEVPDLLDPSVPPLEDRVEEEAWKFLDEYGCGKDFREEYTVYCISEFQGDPEDIITECREKIVSLLKDEKLPLDEEEIKSTLSFTLKYAKDDATIVDWDGAFIFDPHEDFDSNIELLEIANLQLLKFRALDSILDARLERMAELLGTTKKRWLFPSKSLRGMIKDIIQIRTESIMESEAIEKNIKLIGDWYSAKLYDLSSRKFHLDSWRKSIGRKLDTLEDVYTMTSENLSITFAHALDALLQAGWVVLLIGWFVLFFLEYGMTKK